MDKVKAVNIVKHYSLITTMYQNLLTDIRFELNLTVKQFADILHVSERTMYRWLCYGMPVDKIDEVSTLLRLHLLENVDK